MATVAERVSVVEVQVANLDEKLDDLKVDMKDIHDCLDRTGDTISKTLADMREESSNQHNELAGKIKALEKQKEKLMMYGMVGLAFIAGLGWTGQLNIQTITKFFGV
jgi:lipid II:glycine glycyltransferase (peptidoglycan interpeptide bridge formation enzyme)